MSIQIDDKNVNFMAEIFMSSVFMDVRFISISKAAIYSRFDGEILCNTQFSDRLALMHFHANFSFMLWSIFGLPFCRCERRIPLRSEKIPNSAYLERQERRIHLIKLFYRD